MNQKKKDRTYFAAESGKKPCKEQLFSMGLILAVCLFSFGWILFGPKETYSQEENRSLTSSLQWDLSKISDGSFQNSVNDFVNDQFWGRRQLVELNADEKAALGQKDLSGNYMQRPPEGGVYLGKEGHLYEVLLPPDRTLQKNVQALADFAEETGLPFYMMTVPSGAQEQAEWLPENAPSYDQTQALSLVQTKFNGIPQAKVLNLFDTLSLHKSSYDYYFKTDHHWNLYGAYEGYSVLTKAMGETPIPLSSYTLKNQGDFYGTLYSQALLTAQGADCFLLPYYQGEENVTQEANGQSRNGLYWESYLNGKDKYSTYLGGNHNLDVIRNPKAKSSKKLLVLRDSYFNSMAPFLADQFSEIDAVDLRHYTGDLSQYIRENGITEIAAVYSIKQLCDVNISRQLG